jgi:hypothetical protein
LTVRIPIDEYSSLCAIAKQRDITMNHVIRDAILREAIELGLSPAPEHAPLENVRTWSSRTPVAERGLKTGPVAREFVREDGR